MGSMAGRATQQSFRKYLGVIKDSTTVGLARVNSDYKELDIAIVRATNHVERPAKEKHIKSIFLAVSAARSRADVAYCIHALARRLSKTHNWAVALKTLIVIHRALREVDPTFREELINYGRSRSIMLNLSHFKDDSSAKACDYSAWVRTYALYLEERLECFHMLKYDVETDPVRAQDLETAELLVQLPVLQQLLFGVVNCQPQGAAVFNHVIHLALAMVADEGRKIYNAINGCTINMVDKFFEMQRHDALKAFDIYVRAGQQAERLSEFYEVCKSIAVAHGGTFSRIEQPPASFLTAMEEYVREAPRFSTVRKIEERAAPKVTLAIEDKKASQEQESPPPPPEPYPLVSKEPDLLGSYDANPESSELDAKNALALAIVPVDFPSVAAPPAGLASENGTTEWELALLAAPTSNDTSAAASKLAGGLDKLTLDRLYDDANRRANQPTSFIPAPMAGTMMRQPISSYDPFYAVNAIGAPHPIQMATTAQQQQSFILQQQSFVLQQQSFMLQQQQQQQHMMLMMGQQQFQPVRPNPLGNPYNTTLNPQPHGFGTPLQSSGHYTSLI